MKMKKRKKNKPTPPRIDHQAFIRMLTDRFPSIAAAIDEDDRGVLTLEMHEFADATREAIERSDLDSVREHLRFVDEVLSRADDEVENAVAVSYLEHLDLSMDDDIHIRARCMLSSRQLAIYKALEEGWKQTGEWLKQTRKQRGR